MQFTFSLLQTIRDYDNSGVFHYIPYKNPENPCQITCLKDSNTRVSWSPQLLTGDTVDKFLVVFKLVLYRDMYIFAITSFAPKNVCALMSARIRVFQTTGNSSSLDMTPNVTSVQNASARYHETKLLPRLEWMENIVPAGMTYYQMDKDPRVLKVPISFLDRLGNQNQGNCLCEVLIDITFSDPLMTQRNYCVIDDQTSTGVAAAAAASLILSENNPALLNSGSSASAAPATASAIEDMLIVDPESNTTGEFPSFILTLLLLYRNVNCRILMSVLI